MKAETRVMRLQAKEHQTSPINCQKLESSWEQSLPRGPSEGGSLADSILAPRAGKQWISAVYLELLSGISMMGSCHVMSSNMGSCHLRTHHLSAPSASQGASSQKSQLLSLGLSYLVSGFGQEVVSLPWVTLNKTHHCKIVCRGKVCLLAW